jgi:hypothetical protein
MAQVVELLPSKSKALSSNSNTVKKKKKVSYLCDFPSLVVGSGNGEHCLFVGIGRALIIHQDKDQVQLGGLEKKLG